MYWLPNLSWVYLGCQAPYMSRFAFSCRQADDPLQFCLVSVKIGVNCVDNRLTTAPMISGGAREMLGELPFAVYDGHSTVR